MSEVRELAEKHVSAFNERAWSRAHDLYAPDLVMIEPAGNDSSDRAISRNR